MGDPNYLVSGVILQEEQKLHKFSGFLKVQTQQVCAVSLPPPTLQLDILGIQEFHSPFQQKLLERQGQKMQDWSLPEKNMHH